PHERERGARAPVAEQPEFDVIGLERLAQQRVGPEGNHSGREGIARAPVGVHQVEFVARHSTDATRRTCDELCEFGSSPSALSAGLHCGAVRTADEGVVRWRWGIAIVLILTAAPSYAQVTPTPTTP